MRPILLLALVGCSPDQELEGIAVGNPGGTRMRAAPADGLSFTWGRVERVDVTLTACDGTALPLGQDISIETVGESVLYLPAGEWCRLDFDGPDWVVLVGEAEDGAVAELVLAPESISFAPQGGFTVDGDDFVVQLAAPGWTSYEALEMDPAEVSKVKDDHPLVQPLSDAIEVDSSFIRDLDGEDAITDADEVVAGAG